jgi:hypothetical protein
VDSVLVEVFDRPDFRDKKDSTICIGQSINYVFTADGTYNWTPNVEANFSNPKSPIFSPTTTRSYYLDFVDSKGCSVKDTLKFTVNSPINAIINGDTTICKGSILTLGSTNTASKYRWYDGTSLIGTSQSLSYAKAKNNGFIRLELENASACKSVDSVKISVFDFPLLNIPDDTIICASDTFQLNLNPSYTYSWTPNIEIQGATSNKPKFFPSFSRQYIATVFDNVECTIKDTMIVTAISLPTASISAPDSACFGEAITITGSGGITQNWVIDGKNFTGSIVSLSPKADVNVQLTTSAGNGCENKSSKVIQVDDSLALQILADDSVCLNSTVALTTSVLNIKKLQWSTGQLTNVPVGINVLINKDTTISVVGTNDFGCSISQSKTIKKVDLPVFDILGGDSLCK